MAACNCNGLNCAGCRLRTAPYAPVIPDPPPLSPADTGRVSFTGYRDCPLCEGRGLNPALPHRTCPKCHGERKVPR